jgi:DNA invertase Pin-like site-specific DNA recombinase
MQKAYFLHCCPRHHSPPLTQHKIAAKTSAENKVRFPWHRDRILPTMTDMPLTRIGYARVSSPSQKLDSQVDALINAGCIRVFTDKASGTKSNRPEWDKLVAFLRPGDILVVTELSRMSRSLFHLLQLAQQFTEKEIGLVSLREHIDTGTATGRAFFSLLGAIPPLELELKAERTAAGREAAKARGRTGGRPRTDQAKLEKARVLYENSPESAAGVCKTFGIGRRTFFDYLAKVRSEIMKTRTAGHAQL